MAQDTPNSTETGTDIAERDTAAEIAVKAEQVEMDLAAQMKAEMGLSAQDIIIPLLKFVQALSRDVGDARPGEFVNSLSGESYGDNVEFVIAGFHKGRFWAPRGERTRIATGPVVPSNWDSPWDGQLFVDVPEAEETYRERVNEGELEWGHGPQISTTYNFVGFVVGSEIPVKLSLMRAQTRAAQKMMTLLGFMKAPWEVVFNLSATSSESKSGEPFKLMQVAQGRKTLAPERQQAVSLAQILQARNVQYTGDEEFVTEQTARTEAPKNTLLG